MKLVSSSISKLYFHCPYSSIRRYFLCPLKNILTNKAQLLVASLYFCEFRIVPLQQLNSVSCKSRYSLYQNNKCNKNLCAMKKSHRPITHDKPRPESFSWRSIKSSIKKLALSALNRRKSSGSLKHTSHSRSRAPAGIKIWESSPQSIGCADFLRRLVPPKLD